MARTQHYNIVHEQYPNKMRILQYTATHKDTRYIHQVTEIKLHKFAMYFVQIQCQ